MIRKLKQSVLIKNTFIYALLQLGNKGIPFLLLPILTRYLSTDDYGMIAMYTNLVGVAAIFVGLSIPGAVGVNYFHLDKEQLRRYIGNAVNILLLSTAVVLLLITLFQKSVTERIDFPMAWVYIAVAAALMQSITDINLVLWRSQQRAAPFALYEIAQTIVNISISLILVVVLEYGWEGRMTAIAVTTIVFGGISLFFVTRRGYFTFDKSAVYVKDILKFGVPLIPHQLGLWIRSGVDVFLISAIAGIAQTGLYVVGYQLGAIVGMMAHAFNNAYSPYLYNKLKDINDEDKRKLVVFTYAYFFGIFIMAIGLSAFFAFLMPFFLGESFQGSEEFIIWIAVAFSFHGMYLMVVNYIFYVKKNHWISVITLSCSLLHVALSYVLIKSNGALGAAHATTISFAVTFVAIWILSMKTYKMPWNIMKHTREKYD